MSRMVVLDTETTGLEPSAGHRIIEIGCIELVDRQLTDRSFHQYVQPERKVDAEAVRVHGISDEFLKDKPPFAEVAEAFLEFVRGAELIIHNAPFDVGFINHEFSLLKLAIGKIEQYCTVTDSLVMARKKHPGQRNSLDALCKRYYIDNTHRTLHGALLDAQILADVYLRMTGGQADLALGATPEGDGRQGAQSTLKQVSAARPPLKVVQPSADELRRHREVLAGIAEQSGVCLWEADRKQQEQPQRPAAEHTTPTV